MIILLLTIFVSYVMAQTLGRTHDLELTAGLFVLYIIGRRVMPSKHYATGLSSHQVLDSVMFTLIILNIVLTSGGVMSPLFFLTYFLLFALALMLEPIVSVASALGIVAVGITYLPAGSPLADLLPLVSLPLLVPFAMYLGSAFRAREAEKAKIATLTEERSDAQQDALIFLATVVREHVSRIEEAADSLPSKDSGDDTTRDVRSRARRLQKLIDEFEKSY